MGSVIACSRNVQKSLPTPVLMLQGTNCSYPKDWCRLRNSVLQNIHDCSESSSRTPFTLNLTANLALHLKVRRILKTPMNVDVVVLARHCSLLLGAWPITRVSQMLGTNSNGMQKEKS